MQPRVGHQPGGHPPAGAGLRVQVGDHDLDSQDVVRGGQCHDPRPGAHELGRAGRGDREDLAGVGALEHRRVHLGDRRLPALAHDRALVEPGVVDGHAGGGGQGGDDALVGGAERLAAALVGEVQVAEHLPTHPDRDAEERAHHRVARREPDSGRMRGQVVQADRRGVADEQSEDPPAVRQLADARLGLLVDPHVHELGQVPVRAQHAQRAVGGVHQVGRGLDDAAQRGAQLEPGGHRDHRTEQAALVRVGHAVPPARACDRLPHGPARRRYQPPKDAGAPRSATTPSLSTTTSSQAPVWAIRCVTSRTVRPAVACSAAAVTRSAIPASRCSPGSSSRTIGPIGEHGAGEGQALGLPTGDLRAVRADPGAQAGGEAVHPRGQLGGRERSAQLVGSGVAAGQSQVLLDGRVEQVGLLVDRADHRAHDVLRRVRGRRGRPGRSGHSGGPAAAAARPRRWTCPTRWARPGPRAVRPRGPGPGPPGRRRRPAGSARSPLPARRRAWPALPRTPRQAWPRHRRRRDRRVPGRAAPGRGRRRRPGSAGRRRPPGPARGPRRAAR